MSSVPRPLTGSTNGTPIRITTNNLPGTDLHAVPADETHEVHMQVTNRNAGAQTLIVDVGGTGAAGEDMEVAVPTRTSVAFPPNSNPVVVEGGANGRTIRGYGSVLNDLSVMGYYISRQT